MTQASEEGYQTVSSGPILSRGSESCLNQQHYQQLWSDRQVAFTCRSNASAPSWSFRISCSTDPSSLLSSQHKQHHSSPNMHSSYQKDFKTSDCLCLPLAVLSTSTNQHLKSQPLLNSSSSIPTSPVSVKVELSHIPGVHIIPQNAELWLPPWSACCATSCTRLTVWEVKRLSQRKNMQISKLAFQAGCEFRHHS